MSFARCLEDAVGEEMERGSDEGERAGGEMQMEAECIEGEEVGDGMGDVAADDVPAAVTISPASAASLSFSASTAVASVKYRTMSVTDGSSCCVASFIRRRAMRARVSCGLNREMAVWKEEAPATK